jgi:hypothetical protein
MLNPNPKLKGSPNWYTLFYLIANYKPAVLATAIENSGVYVIDSVGRLNQAAMGTSTDPYSAAYAIKLLACAYAELEEAPHLLSWRSERYDIEEHPLERFGWPLSDLPNFSAYEQDPYNLMGMPDWPPRSVRNMDRLIENAGGTVTGLADKLAISVSAITKVIRKLEAAENTRCAHRKK